MIPVLPLEFNYFIIMAKFTYYEDLLKDRLDMADFHSHLFRITTDSKHLNLKLTSKDGKVKQKAKVNV